MAGTEQEQVEPPVTCPGGPSSFRECMIDVGDRLNQLDVQHMSCAASEYLPETTRDGTVDAVGLLTSLEDAAVLGEGDVLFLIELLKTIGRDEVAEMVSSEAGDDGRVRPLSSYKKYMTHVAMALEVDFRRLMYAAKDGLPELRQDDVKSSVDILQAIESKWELEAERVKFLLSCLKAVRRWDLIFHIAPELSRLSLDLPPPSLPPCSRHFGCATMLLRLKKDHITRFSEEVKQLHDSSTYHPLWKKRFDPFFVLLVESFSSDVEKLRKGDRNITLMCDTLREMSSCVMRWAALLIHFLKEPSAKAIGTEAKQCRDQFETFQSMLPSEWIEEQLDQVNNQWGGEPYPLRITAQKAKGYFEAFGEGVIGEADLYDREFLSEDLCIFEALTLTFGKLRIFAAWTSTVLDFALRYQPALSEDEEEMLRTLVQRHWHSFDNNQAALDPALVQGLKILISSHEFAGIQESSNDAPQAYPAQDIHLPLESVLLLTAMVVLKCSLIPMPSRVLRLKLSEYIRGQKDAIEKVRLQVIDRMHEAVCDAIEHAKAKSVKSFLDRLYPAAEYGKYQHELKQLFDILL